jgi:hypothetical protein
MHKEKAFWPLAQCMQESSQTLTQNNQHRHTLTLDTQLHLHNPQTPLQHRQVHAPCANTQSQTLILTRPYMTCNRPHVGSQNHLPTPRRGLPARPPNRQNPSLTGRCVQDFVSCDSRRGLGGAEVSKAARGPEPPFCLARLAGLSGCHNPPLAQKWPGRFRAAANAPAPARLSCQE